jgi:hypothetical protein
MGKILAILIVLALAVASGFYFRYGTLSPCSALRITLREQLAASPNGLDRIVGVALSDTILNPLLAAKYGGPLTPAHCLKALIDPADAEAQK